MKSPIPCLLAFAALSVTARVAASPGSVDPSFDPGLGPRFVTSGRTWNVVLQPDAKMIVGGDLTAFDLTPVPAIFRLNTDGSLDRAFDVSVIAPFSSYDEAQATRPLCLDGQSVLVGGQFHTIDGIERQLVRLNSDGSRDQSFDPRFSATVNGQPSAYVQVDQAAVQSDGKILVRGTFDSINGAPVKQLARLNPDGSVDSFFSPAVGNRVSTFALQADGEILVSSSTGVARLKTDGSVDSTFQFEPLAPDGSSYVTSILIQPDSKIVISGQYGGFSEDYTGRVNIDGSRDVSYPILSGAAVAIDKNGKVFFHPDNYDIGSSLQRLNSDGSRDGSFSPPQNLASTFGVVEQGDGNVIVFGDYYPGPYGIARLHSDGSRDDTFNVGIGLTNIYEVGFNGASRAADDKLLVWGKFNYVDKAARKKLARLNHDGSVDESFDPGDLLTPGYSDYDVSAVAVQSDGDTLLAFYDQVVRLDQTGHVDPSFNYEPSSYAAVSAIAAVRDGKVLVATGDGVLRLNSDGSIDPAFNSALPGGAVTQLFVEADGRIVVNQSETVKRLNSDGSIDSSFVSRTGFGLAIIAVQPDDKILITHFDGFFTDIIRLNTDGTEDAGFHRVETHGVTAAVIDETSIYITGAVEPFQASYGLDYRVGLHRLDANGTLDAAFQVELPDGAYVSSLLLQPDGQLITAGTFDQVNGVERHGIARLDAQSRAKLANISTRARVGNGDSVEIAGFIIAGESPKNVIIRAIGPSLLVNGTRLEDALEDPELELHGAKGELIARNDNWFDTQQDEIIASGLVPGERNESVIAITLAPGAYTAVVRGHDGGEGIALVEVYDVDETTTSRLKNISTRGFVGTSDDVMIAGFILRGSENAAVVLRAIGPSLSTFGVANAVQNPRIEVHDDSGTIVAANDDWKETQPADLIAAGLAPADEHEAALLIDLPPGAYTAIVRGDSGVALVEAFDVR